ncbi:cell division ATP-binding protein FtsE [Candidatus Uhrbacteria bacterium]|nr:cell division ATP-binding protein FtsE [Candidatus Uhrbacteria bacterium]
MITFEKVSKIYPGNSVALQDLTLTIDAGEFVSIVGQSGVGKTTLVKLLIAEERASAGSIVVGGWDITHIRASEVPLLRRQIGVVFQDYKLLPKKSVWENVAFALEVSGAPRERIAAIVPQVIKIVGLEDKLHRYPRQLSGGEQQRVSIARALVHRPKVLVADEPTGNLDALNSQEIIELLKRINAFGTTIILVTHNRGVVNTLKKRVITMEGGTIAHDQKIGKYVL